jgi:propanol-preferring alcohol dehydrogenase
MEDVMDPAPGPQEVVLRVMACGIDGTDLKLLDGFGYTPNLPFIMGHEPSGIVDEVGPGVTQFRPGDRVIPYIFLIPPNNPWYRSPREQLCPEMSGVIGVKEAPGGYAERMRVPARQLIRLPEGLAWPDAAVLCDAGLTAWHAVGRARIMSEETVLVVGAGGVGSFVIQFACRAGARVIAVEQTPAKLAWAIRMGAHEALSNREAVVADEVLRLTGGLGVECVLDMVGSSASLAVGLDALQVGGRLVVVGYTPDEFPLSPKRLAQNELELIGSRGGTSQELADLVDLASSGGIRSIVTQTRPLDKANEALAELRSGNVLGRLVLEPGLERPHARP